MTFETELRTGFLTYAYAVVYARALPDIYDGLKPVQRRCVYAAAQSNFTHAKPQVKSARVVGEVMGKYHPHGDQAIYDTIANLVRPWKMNVPLFQGFGNWGSVGGRDGAAAPRYTETRLAEASSVLTQDLWEETVDWVPNYDGSREQPVRLTAGFPNLLVNGNTGIAVGLACSFLPHNLNEVNAAVIHRMNNPECSVADIMKIMPGPDFPTAGVLVDSGGIEGGYKTGRGSVVLRAKASIEEISARRMGIVFTEMPFDVSPEVVAEKIAELVHDNKIDGISNVADFTDRKNGLKLVVSIKNGFNPEVILAQLYKLTPLQTGVSFNHTAMVDGIPQESLSILDLLDAYIRHRKLVINRRTQFRLKKAKAREHIVEGLLLAHANIEEILKIVKSSDSPAAASAALQERFGFSDAQVKHVMAMTIYRLTGLELRAIEDELKKLRETIKDLEDILASDARVIKIISDDLSEVSKKYGWERRTQIIQAGDDPVAAVSPAGSADVPEEDVTVLLNVNGELQLQSGEVTVPYVDALTLSNKDSLGIVTDAGNLYSLQALVVKPGAYPVSDFLTLEAGEVPIGVVPREASEGTVVLVTSEGFVKRIEPAQFAKKDGLPIIKFKNPNEKLLSAVYAPAEEGFVTLVSAAAKMLKFDVGLVRPQGRTGGGVAGMKLAAGDTLLAGRYTTDTDMLVTITDQGAGKATPVGEYPAKGRGTGGVRCHALKKGETQLAQAGLVTGVAHAASARSCKPVKVVEKRDASGVKVGLSGELKIGAL